MEIKVDTKDLERAVDLGNLLVDKLKEARSIVNELASKTEHCMNFNITVHDELEDD